MDGSLVILSLVHIFVSLLKMDKGNMLGMVKVLRLLRALRPLRYIIYFVCVCWFYVCVYVHVKQPTFTSYFGLLYLCL